MALAALAIAGVGATGLVFGSQMGWAQGSSSDSDSTSSASDAAVVEEATPEGPWGSMGKTMGFGGLGGPGVGEAAQCMATELVIDLAAGMSPEGMKAMADLPPEQIQAAWEKCSATLPEELKDTVEQFRTCFADEDGSMPSGMSGIPAVSGMPGMSGMAGVAVMTPDELSLLHFGQGDGSVTITKSGDSYTVTQTGDVIATDAEAMGAKLGAMMPELGAKLAECGIDMPAGGMGFRR